MAAALSVKVGNNLRDYSEHCLRSWVPLSYHTSGELNRSSPSPTEVCRFSLWPRGKRGSLYWELQMDLGGCISATGGLSDHWHSKHWRQKHPHRAPFSWLPKLRNSEPWTISLSQHIDPRVSSETTHSEKLREQLKSYRNSGQFFASHSYPWAQCQVLTDLWEKRCL